ncbi:hypothetical protein, partial [Phaeobacter sp. S60]|uniref:hypothetical protein n=1 Tax=Phaeobacter sp. S60 TaxID=1569353 RepID=UPI001A7E4701
MAHTFPCHTKKLGVQGFQAEESLGSLPTCGDAAAGLQRNFTRTLLPYDAKQPNHDIQAGRSAGAAASAKGLLKADLQACTIDPGDTAISVDVSDAQKAGFA